MLLCIACVYVKQFYNAQSASKAALHNTQCPFFLQHFTIQSVHAKQFLYNTLTGTVTEIEVLGCGIVSWKPPAGNAGLELDYSIRFFDGQTYETTSLTTGYRRQQHFSDTGRQWARADDIPNGTTVYADVRNFRRVFGIITNTVLSDSCTEYAR